MSVRVTGQHTSYFERQVHPLVKIEGERIRLLNPGYDRSERGRDLRECAERAVDVKPKLLFMTQVGEPCEVIRSSRVHGSRVADNAERSAPGAPVHIDSLAKRVNVYSKLVVDSDAAKGAITQPKKLGALLRPTVSFGRAVQRQHRMIVRLKTKLSDIEASLRVASDGQPGDVCHRTSADQHPACFWRHSHHLRQPGEHLMFNKSRRLIEARHMRIHS